MMFNEYFVIEISQENSFKMYRSCYLYFIQRNMFMFKFFLEDIKKWEAFEKKYSPVLSASSDHELGKCAAKLGVTGATKWSVLWAVAETDAGGDPHVEEEWPLCGLHAASPTSLKGKLTNVKWEHMYDLYIQKKVYLLLK